MAIPTGFGSRKSSGVRSIRFFKSGTGTADYADNAWLFTDGNNFTPLPIVAPAQFESGTVVPTVLGPTPHGTGTSMGDQRPGIVDITPVPLVWSCTIRIFNDGAGDILFSFDGTTDHGIVKAGKEVVYRNRIESGIAIKGNTIAFRVEAW